MNLKETDIINDIDDLNEIEFKIKYNLTHNNNKRIINSIDFNHYSCNNSAKRLEKIVDCIIYNKNYRSIK